MNDINEFVLSNLNQAINESNIKDDTLDLSFLCSKFDIPNPIQNLSKKDSKVSNNILKLRKKFNYPNLCKQTNMVYSEEYMWFNFYIQPFIDFCKKHNYSVEVTEMYIKVGTLVNNWMITPNPNGSKLNLLHNNKFVMWGKKCITQDYHYQFSNQMSEFGLYDILSYVDKHDKRILKSNKKSDRLLELFKEIEK